MLKLWTNVKSLLWASDACHAGICTLSVSLRTGRTCLKKTSGESGRGKRQRGERADLVLMSLRRFRHDCSLNRTESDEIEIERKREIEIEIEREWKSE